MNYEITIRNIKGKEERIIIIEPSNPLEEELFKSIFSGEVAVEKSPNGNKIVIQPKKKEE